MDKQQKILFLSNAVNNLKSYIGHIDCIKECEHLLDEANSQLITITEILNKLKLPVTINPPNQT